MRTPKARRCPLQFVKKHSSDQVGAIVIGGDYQGLGIVQSLGRRGVPVCIVDDEISIARFSRYATYAQQARNLRDETATVETLLRASRRWGLEGWVLYPTRDETVAALSRQRSRLVTRFRVPTPDWATIRWAWNKRNTYRLAKALGIPIPRTWQPGDLRELRSLDVTFPAVVKPAVKEPFFRATRAKAWCANHSSELEELYLRALRLVGPDAVLVQELIPGDGDHQFAYCAFFKEGQAAGSMTVRRARQHPSLFGRASTFVETVDLPEIEALSTRFLRAVGYYGLAEIEYKRDPRDGQYRLLDVNARTWGYHSLGFQAGIDFPYLLFADQTGQPVKCGRGRPGVSWVRLVTDLPTGIAGILAGKLDWKWYLRSLREAHVESVFSREDPMPGIAELVLVPYLTVRRGF